MRIIAGTHRGRPLLGPEDDQTTRPITDRVKENLFNRLHSLGVLGYGRVLDLFCGTGSMGLEALSRGAGHCTFVDLDRGAIERLEQNLDALHVDPDHAEVLTGSALLPGWTHGAADGSLTLALIDPPFPMVTADLSPFYALLDT
ncbi:MAG: RsmD family RNA methyltransferase, partial [Planctomycetota bacterium]